jgi:hypothetical protein
VICFVDSKLVIGTVTRKFYQVCKLTGLKIKVLRHEIAQFALLSYDLGVIFGT